MLTIRSDGDPLAGRHAGLAALHLLTCQYDALGHMLCWAYSVCVQTFPLASQALDATSQSTKTYLAKWLLTSATAAGVEFVAAVAVTFITIVLAGQNWSGQNGNAREQ